MILLIIGLSLLFSSLSLKAEYRVYQYYVRSKHNYLQENNTYLVTSSLDPVSYVSYHGGHDALSVDLLRTWTCPGHTGSGKDYCASPFKEMGQQSFLNEL